MTAQITGFVTREEAGLRRPRSVSRNITPERGGVSEHYGGGPQSAAHPGSDHDQCIYTWLGWQDYHMDKHGWVDLAYTGGFCNHGYAFAGRGAGVRTAANGTNVGNQNFYAIVWIGGEGQTPTQEALDAADWWLEKLRGAGAGNAVKPHNFFKPTGCPGDPIEAHAASRDGVTDFRETPKKEEPTPPPVKATTIVHRVQRSVDATVDGMWGPKTDTRVILMRTASRVKAGWPVKANLYFDIEDAQRIIDTDVDGIWGPLSQAALVAWVKEFQKILRVKSDGYWGPKTDGKLLSIRRRSLNNY